MATFALKSLFKINLSNPGNALLVGAQLRAWAADTRQCYAFSLGVRNTSSSISPASTWVAVLLAGQQSCSVSLIPPFHLVKMWRRQTLLQSLSAPSVLSTSHSLGKPHPKVPQEHRVTQLLSLFFYWKLHQRKQKFKPNIHWSTESPRSGKMAAI